MNKHSPGNAIQPGFSGIRQIIRRVPFTLGMAILLLFVAWWTNSYYHELASSWLNQLGFSPRDFWFLRWERIFLSALVTGGGGVFWFALGMVALTSGVTEWFAGSWRASLTFWGVHLATLVIESLIFLLPLYQLGFPQVRTLFFSRDVGPSAGYMASLGYVITFLPKFWRLMGFTVIFSFLFISFFLPPLVPESQALKLADDMAHLIAFPLGGLTALAIGRKSKL